MRQGARQCAIAHKVPTPLIHNVGIIVYKMMKRWKNTKNSSIFQKKKLVYERKDSLQIKCFSGIEMMH